MKIQIEYNKIIKKTKINNVNWKTINCDVKIYFFERDQINKYNN